MAKNAMEYVTETGDNSNASLGLLGLLYHNNIALTQFKEDLLVQFQASYQHTIGHFFKTLPLLKQHLIEQLPATQFCFTKPMLKCLKDGGVVLQLMPY
jgi:hypothetical protein